MTTTIDHDPLLVGLQCGANTEPHNGISHAELTALAYSILMDDLRSHGNRPGEMQRNALCEILHTITRYAQGTTTGRKAFNLATGCGKTSAVIAWITAAHRLGLDHVPVAVAQSKVEALCDLKAALVAHGVPEEKIGIKHSHGLSAALPSTGDDDRLYQLVTHSRVRGGRDNELFTLHKGRPRAVMIYDETLFKSDAQAVSDREVRKSLASYREEVRYRDKEKYAGILAYLSGCVTAISDTLESLRKREDKEGVTITLPELSYVELEGYLALLNHAAEWEPLRELLRLTPHELRVVATEQAEGLIYYQVRVPKELKNVMVLDASYPIRKLVHLDKTITNTSRYADTEVKRWDHVTIHQMLSFGGRHSITRSFTQSRRENRHISREVVAVVKGAVEAMPDKGVLIFTFKARPRDVDITGKLKLDLVDAGIRIDEKLPDGKPRFRFLTWGDETARNDCSHCSTVIMAGVLHRNHLDLASCIVGQKDDLKATVSNSDVREILDSEIVHSIYQGMSRGSCRVVDDGQASPMDLYLIHRDITIREELNKVLPGVKWTLWEQKYGKPEAEGVAAKVALQIMEYLKGLPEGCIKVSIQRLKEGLALENAAARTFTRAVALVSDTSKVWMLDGRSLVRAASVFAEG